MHERASSVSTVNTTPSTRTHTRPWPHQPCHDAPYQNLHHTPEVLARVEAWDGRDKLGQPENADRQDCLKTPAFTLVSISPRHLYTALYAGHARDSDTAQLGHCRNSGTWGSPDDAKVEPTPSVPPEDQQEAKPGPGTGRPISARRPDQHDRPPEGEWVASRSNLSPGPRQDQKVPGFRGPAGGRTAPEGLFRTQEDKINDVGARR